MAKTTTKKTPKPKEERTEPESEPITLVRTDANDLILSAYRVREAIETLQAAGAVYAEEMAKIQPDGVMPQRLIALAHLAHQGADTLETVEKAFKEKALELRLRGKFEDGDYGVFWNLRKGKRQPAWKDEAISRAKAVAKLKGKKFDEKRYVEDIMESTPASADSYQPLIQPKA